ncbi:MAG: IS66 family insertion sequence element accessory protein TnpB [Lachnospiraceae bacterium]|nr:IS66 family insertion sequence element accessory protein TnpB [Lachnospiraceae bacterium]
MLRNADPGSFAAVYVVCGYTDMRYGIDTLAALIESRYHLDLFVPDTLFLFCGRHANKIKGLIWEGDGFLLLTKRIEEGRFSWPRYASEARQLTHQEYEWLMKGFSIDPPIRISYPERPA